MIIVRKVQIKRVVSYEMKFCWNLPFLMSWLIIEYLPKKITWENVLLIICHTHQQTIILPWKVLKFQK